MSHVARLLFASAVCLLVACESSGPSPLLEREPSGTELGGKPPVPFVETLRTITIQWSHNGLFLAGAEWSEEEVSNTVVITPHTGRVQAALRPLEGGVRDYYEGSLPADEAARMGELAMLAAEESETGGISINCGCNHCRKEHLSIKFADRVLVFGATPSFSSLASECAVNGDLQNRFASELGTLLVSIFDSESHRASTLKPAIPPAVAFGEVDPTHIGSAKGEQIPWPFGSELLDALRRAKTDVRVNQAVFWEFCKKHHEAAGPPDCAPDVDNPERCKRGPGRIPVSFRGESISVICGPSGFH